MSLTFEELKERLLEKYDPDDFLEFLEITSEELLDRFEDKLTNRLYFFTEELDEDEEKDEDEIE
jgi:histone deacetylase complex regulatory component SIN3